MNSPMSLTDIVPFALVAVALVAYETRWYFIRRERVDLAREIARAARQAKGDYSE